MAQLGLEHLRRRHVRLRISHIKQLALLGLHDELSFRMEPMGKQLELLGVELRLGLALWLESIWLGLVLQPMA